MAAKYAPNDERDFYFLSCSAFFEIDLLSPAGAILEQLLKLAGGGAGGGEKPHCPSSLLRHTPRQRQLLSRLA